MSQTLERLQGDGTLRQLAADLGLDKGGVSRAMRGGPYGHRFALAVAGLWRRRFPAQNDVTFEALVLDQEGFDDVTDAVPSGEAA